MVHVGERVVENTQLVLEEGVNLHSFKGLYVGINLFGRFGTAPPASEFAEACPVQKGFCETGKPAGMGGLLRIGYSLGVIGVEGVGFASFDHSSVDAEYQSYLVPAMSKHYGPARHEEIGLNRFGAGGAFGARVTSKHAIIRFTFGSAFGLAFRNVDAQVDAQFNNLPNPGCTNCQNSDHRNWNNGASKALPLLMFDGGLLLGSTPGTKFQLGVLTMIEFYGDDPIVTEASNEDNVQGLAYGHPSLQVMRGTEVFIGPVLGLQFGE
jgi:hypothetical protein